MAFTCMLIEVILLLMAVPIGYLIAYLTKEELRKGRIWFRAVFDVSILLAALFIILKIYYLAWTFGFIMICSAVSLWKSHDTG